jgi:Na+-driven multidrug efflux pump
MLCCGKQSTFFLAAAAASRLGTSALAAHAVVSQLWLLTSYFVDGFAVAGTVLGSRLAGAMPSPSAVRCDLVRFQGGECL